MRSVTPMRAAKTGYIIMSVLLCVLGVVLFVWPGVSVAVIGELLGIGMIVFGAVKVTGYLSRDLFRLAFQYDLAFGVLLMALGIVTLTHPGETIGFLCVVYGILVLSDGLFKVQIAVDAKRFGIEDKYTEGRTQEDWVRWCYEETRKKHPDAIDRKSVV